MSQINCEACETLRVNAAAFVQHGVTNTECNSMANDTGINPNLSPKHNDATDLHTANDCLVGKMNDDIESYNICDWQDFMHRFLSNLHGLLKLMICALGGIWTKIHDLISRVTSLEGRMTNVENRLTAVEGDISNLKTRMTNVEGDVSNLKGRMTTVEGKVSTIEGKVNTLESTVAGHTSAISNLQSSVSTLSTNYTNLSNTVSGHTTSITNLNGQVNTLQTGYVNLKHILDQLIAALGGSSNTVTVVKKYSYTVPVEKFIDTWEANCTTEGGGSSYVTAWFSGASGIECYISIPVTEMETVVGVWAQPYVVPNGNSFDGKGKAYMETVAVQTWSQQGNNIIVNFDTYELAPPRIESGGVVTQNGGPYPVKVDFLVVGTKTITPLS